ncbi:MAG: molecular chaperone HtpG [Paludibacter sp.]|nr:molecular chaperone HtpG [Paludibacter sp.]
MNNKTQGTIGVTSDNIFPIIKKFLYSDHEIFLRELVSNAVDATQKLKTLASVGDYKGELGDLTVRISVDKKKKTITVSDRGIGMTADEIERYINQIAFSGAEEFVEKYKNDAQAIIGHFGLGFYSSFMVSEKVEIFTQSYKEDAPAVHWSCKGDPEFTLEQTIKSERGTDIVLHIDKENSDFLEENKITELLHKYCRFLPIEIAFGKKKEWKDGKEVETTEDNIVNETQPLWTLKPANLTDENYSKFYHNLYPMAEEPLFHIHLNVDYPFHLTGVLYFPKIKNNFEFQRNKIQLYCNQVFVTDAVEGIVPEYLTLLNGVLDSPDIPLNVSRSYLQSDQNVKKISSHITKKVADRLAEIFKNDRTQFEDKWNDLKIFIQYGMLSDEKFYERAEKFTLLTNTEKKYFTLEEYKALIAENQKDKDETLIYLYATNIDEQYTYINAAREKGYDVLLMDGQLDIHAIGQMEQKFEKSRFVRVDSEVIDKLIVKNDVSPVNFTDNQRDALIDIFNSSLPKTDKTNFIVTFENLGAEANPVFITQNEFMRRMKDMSALGGGMYSFYGDMPDSFSFVVNATHPLVENLLKNQQEICDEKVATFIVQIDENQKNINEIDERNKSKKYDEISQEDKDTKDNLNKKIEALKAEKRQIYTAYATENKQVGQLVDLALLANNMLKGEALANFVKRSVELM